MAKQLNKKDKFQYDEDDKKSVEIKVIKSRAIESMKGYDNDFAFTKPDITKPLSITTEAGLIECLEANENVEIEARFFAYNRKTKEAEQFVCKNKKSFLEVFKSNKKRGFRESIDSFQYDDMNTGTSIIGAPDYTPLIGGPFAKSLYYYDYLQMANAAFYAANNDPFAKRIIDTIVHFTIGKGFRADCEDKKALALWEAFSEVNKIPEMIKKIARELIIYGEHMIYWLPEHETKINYNVGAGERKIEKGLLPRIRLIDPTTIWEVITAPEDITNVYAYKQIFPTQYQTYTVQGVPATKFIYQQLPADAMMHFKVNAVDNEKRGRSDLYSILGYLKRMRDVINYELVKKLKNAAWSIDTTIDGSQVDIQSYMDSQTAMGTIPTAGSEFVHSKKIERNYLGNQSGSMGSDQSFEIILSAIAAGSIPTSYFGTHLSGGSTRAGAVVSTEPVQKLLEDRQGLYETILIALAKRFFSNMGMENVKMEFTFPEIVTQDRSAKLKDLALAVSEGFMSKKRAASIAAKEFGITDFDYDTEKEEIAKDPPSVMSQGETIAAPAGENSLSNKGMSSDERKDAKDSDYAAT